MTGAKGETGGQLKRPLLNERVIVVTGGAGLIGRSFVRAIAAEGGIAIIGEANARAGQKVAAEIAAETPVGRAIYAELDITSSDSLQKLIHSLHERFGRVDALVNNAYPRNARYGRKFEEVTYADFCENISTHLGGYFLAAQHFASYFKTQGRGTIVNMGSTYGVVAPRFGVYDGTPMTMPVEYAPIKAGIIHLTRYMAQYFKGANIRVNAISPGGIMDGQPAQFVERYNSYASTKGLLNPSDLQGALLFLLSDMSAFVNGQNIIVDDGWTL